MLLGIHLVQHLVGVVLADLEIVARKHIQQEVQ